MNIVMIIYMILTCPPINAEITINGECVFVCIDAKRVECTGPYDNIKILELLK